MTPGPDSEAEAVPAHIVDAARHVLAQDGLAAATLERISAAAGVSRMTLHRQGVTKSSILQALAGRLEAEHREVMWQALVAKGTARQRLRYALELECELVERNLATLDALSDAARDSIFHEPGSDALTRGPFIEPLERLLRDGSVDQTLTGISDAAETATVLYNTVTHTYRHLRAGHDWSPERAREGVLGLVMEGLVKR